MCVCVWGPEEWADIFIIAQYKIRKIEHAEEIIV